jgi:hypothetical protein
MTAIGRKRTLIFVDFAGSNVRFREKRTLSTNLAKAGRQKGRFTLGSGH